MAESAGNSCILIGYPSAPCPLEISHVGPAIKSSVFGHVINPLLTAFARSRWLNIVLVLFRVFTDHIQPSWPHARSITHMYWYSFGIYTIQTSTILSHQKARHWNVEPISAYLPVFYEWFIANRGSLPMRGPDSHIPFLQENLCCMYFLSYDICVVLCH